MWPWDLSIPAHSPLPSSSVHPSARATAALVEERSQLRQPNLRLHFSMAYSTLENVCCNCGKLSSFENPHNSNIFFFVARVCYFFFIFFSHKWRSFGIHESVSLRDICFKGLPLWADPAIVCSFIHRRQTQMCKLCRQKSMRLLRGDSLKLVLKAESGSALLQAVTQKYQSHQPCSLLKIKSGPLQKWCYSNMAIISARCKLLGCKEWRRLRQAIGFVEGDRRTFVEGTAGEQARGWQSEYFHQDPNCSNQSFSQRQSLLGYKKICPEP